MSAPNPLNARIGRTRPAPIVVRFLEDRQREDEQINLRRRPAGRESFDAVKSLWNAAFLLRWRRTARLAGTPATGR